MTASTDQLSAPWEQFCKEEAQRTAATFMHRVYDYKRRDRRAREIPAAAFAKEFSAAFIEAVLALSTSDQKDDKNHHTHQAPKSKTWWNIFKLGKQKGDEGVVDCNQTGRRTVVLESLASQLVVVESSPLWKPCRLVIAVVHGNSQIEVYTSSKVCVHVTP